MTGQSHDQQRKLVWSRPRGRSGLTAAVFCGDDGRKSGGLAMAVRLRTPRRADVEHGYLIAVELPLLADQITSKKKKLSGNARSAKFTRIER